MRSAFDSGGSPHPNRGHAGHSHFWKRALSRGHFLQAAAAATGAALTTPLWRPGLAAADSGPGFAMPKPVPGTLAPTLPFHVIGFGPPPSEPSSVTDFKGVTAVAAIKGSGTLNNTYTGATTRVLFDTDMRIMDGTYVGVDGNSWRIKLGFV